MLNRLTDVSRDVVVSRVKLHFGRNVTITENNDILDVDNIKVGFLHFEGSVCFIRAVTGSFLERQPVAFLTESRSPSTTQEDLLFLWEETESERGVFSWQKAVTFGLTIEHANMLRVLFAAMFPSRTFVTSMYKPVTITTKR